MIQKALALATITLNTSAVQVSAEFKIDPETYVAPTDPTIGICEGTCPEEPTEFTHWIFEEDWGKALCTEDAKRQLKGYFNAFDLDSDKNLTIRELEAGINQVLADKPEAKDYIEERLEKLFRYADKRD